jgi:hypothetical protein
MSRFLLTGVMLVISFTINAQERDENGNVLHVKCHTNLMQDAYFEANPDAKIEAENFARELNEFTKEFRDTNREGDPYIIPVVFHIIHNNGSENISDAQVKDCIRVMNEDFTASNNGVVSVNSAFQDIVGNVGIEFRLAQRDPEGNCTNGIIRTVSPLTSQGGENLKFISPIWNRARYMNVWVCATIESGAAGYTYYPSSLAGSFGQTNDGIVVRSDYVGSIGTSSVTRSHVLTHEVGHWINLAHPWGSTNEPGVASNCNTDDGVADTPNTIGWTTCNINGQSCGSLDNVENFMEYSYCTKMFTEGQKQRMLASLNSTVAARSSLWQEQNLIVTGVLEEPVLCNADFYGDIRTICPGETVNFTDLSYNSVTNRTWIFEGGEPSVSGEENPTVTYFTPGLYSVSLLADDGVNTASEVKTHYIRVLANGFSSIPFAESFEDLSSFTGSADDIWYTQPVSGSNWEVTTAGSYTGSKSARVRGFLNNQYSVANLYSQTFDLSEVEDNAVLSFKYAYKARSAGSNDRLRVWISRDCGQLWSLRKTLQGQNLTTVDGTQNAEFIPQNQTQWQEVSIPSIVSVFLNPDFRVRFEFESNNGNNIYIDDINLIAPSMITGISDADESGKGWLNVFPVPSAQMINISFETLNSTDNARVLIYDLAGREVDQIYLGNLPAGEHMMQHNIEFLDSGIYILSLQTGNTAAITRKLIKQ